MQQSSQTYEVYALRYATHQERRSRENFIHHDIHDLPMPLDFYIWVIRNKDQTIVVDTGFNLNMALKRHRNLLHSPIEMLEKIGVDVLDVNNVIITHMHYDHAGNLDLFPNAIFHVQEAEMAYCTGSCMTHDVLRKPYEVENIVTTIKHLFNKRLCLYKGDSEIAPGVTIHLIGGHTVGLQVVRVQTKRGWIVLASDAIHYWSNYYNNNPFPIVVDVAKMLDGYKSIEKLADGKTHVIPGHDPMVIAEFPSWPGQSDIVLLHEKTIDKYLFNNPEI